MANRGNTPVRGILQAKLADFVYRHVFTELESQFSAIQTTASKLFGLVPTLLGENIDISEVVDMYEDNLPTPHLVSAELDR